MRKVYAFPDILKPISIVLISLLILLNFSFFTINGGNNGYVKVAAAGEASENNSRKREIYYQSNEAYGELPKLDAAEPNSLAKSWTDHRYGVDENPEGIIGSAVASYAFRVPKGWKVKNTFRRFSPGEDMVVFRLEGEEGVWGAITKVELAGKAVKNEKELAQYYSDHRSSFIGLLKDADSSSFSTKLHLIQGFSSIRTEPIEHYESYSTVEFSRGKYADISHYELQGNLGYIVDVFIPAGELNRENRSIAFLIGESFSVYRFG